MGAGCSTVIVNVNVAASAASVLSSASVAVYVIACVPASLGVPLSVRVAAAKLSPGTAGDSE